VRVQNWLDSTSVALYTLADPEIGLKIDSIALCTAESGQIRAFGQNSRKPLYKIQQMII
jgi:hypothetical protein